MYVLLVGMFINVNNIIVRIMNRVMPGLFRVNLNNSMQEKNRGLIIIRGVILFDEDNDILIHQKDAEDHRA